MNTLRKLQENINIHGKIASLCLEVLESEPMSLHTTFKIGGPASLFTVPSSTQNFCKLLKLLSSQEIPFFIIGGGSNLVFPDLCFDRIVLCTSGLNSIELINNSTTLRCGAGCTWESITLYCVKNCISGLESFAGLPGTTGGAAYMNARCYEKSISDSLSGAFFIKKPYDKEEFYSFHDCDWAYKKSPFQEHGSLSDSIITKAEFKVVQLLNTEQNRRQIQQKSQSYIDDRIQKGHFRYPSAGSVFKNNHSFGKPSGKIIDEVGLRGYSIGGARIAPWHGNFIINEEKATENNVRELISYVISEVKKKTGFILEPEILFANEH